MLETKTAVELYREFAAPQPIIDYHCHLSPDQIADNHRFRTLTEIWLDGDHYKWRAMRTDGVPESLVTGDAPPWEKFQAWAATVPHTLRNPLYHWTHMELAVPFGIRDTLLGPDTARAVYERCNAALASDGFTTQGLLEQFKVLVVCSTDDPADDLAAHKRHRENSRAFTKLYPTWRPDRALALQDLDAWNGWVDKLSRSADVSIATFRDFFDALHLRHALFHELGCRASDHGLDRIFFTEYTASEVAAIFDKARARRPLLADEVEKLRAALLHEFALMDHARGWVQQFHLGAMRNNNTRALRRLGADAGFDSIGDEPQAYALSRFLDRLDSTNQLAKTIL